MKHLNFLFCFIFANLTINCFCNNAEKNTEEKTTAFSAKQLSEQKLQEVISLQTKLEEKKKKLNEAGQKFALNIQQRVADINAERAQNNLQDFKQAVSNKKIETCLSLIQKAVA